MWSPVLGTRDLLSKDLLDVGDSDSDDDNLYADRNTSLPLSESQESTRFLLSSSESKWGSNLVVTYIDMAFSLA